MDFFEGQRSSENKRGHVGCLRNAMSLVTSGSAKEKAWQDKYKSCTKSVVALIGLWKKAAAGCTSVDTVEEQRFSSFAFETCHQDNSNGVSQKIQTLDEVQIKGMVHHNPIYKFKYSNGTFGEVNSMNSTVAGPGCRQTIQLYVMQEDTVRQQGYSETQADISPGLLSAVRAAKKASSRPNTPPKQYLKPALPAEALGNVDPSPRARNLLIRSRQSSPACEVHTKNPEPKSPRWEIPQLGKNCSRSKTSEAQRSGCPMRLRQAAEYQQQQEYKDSVIQSTCNQQWSEQLRAGSISPPSYHRAVNPKSPRWESPLSNKTKKMEQKIDLKFERQLDNTSPGSLAAVSQQWSQQLRSSSPAPSCKNCIVSPRPRWESPRAGKSAVEDQHLVAKPGVLGDSAVTHSPWLQQLRNRTPSPSPKAKYLPSTRIIQSNSKSKSVMVSKEDDGFEIGSEFVLPYPPPQSVMHQQEQLKGSVSSNSYRQMPSQQIPTNSSQQQQQQRMGPMARALLARQRLQHSNIYSM